MSHISIETDNAEQLRAYLASRGIKRPTTVGKGRIGNSNFNVSRSRRAHRRKSSSTSRGGWTMRKQGKFLPATAASRRG